MSAVLALKELGANGMATTATGCTPLHVVAAKGHTLGLRVLMDMGNDVNASNHCNCHQPYEPTLSVRSSLQFCTAPHSSAQFRTLTFAHFRSLSLTFAHFRSLSLTFAHFRSLSLTFAHFRRHGWFQVI
jgi:hypothetical protein